MNFIERYLFFNKGNEVNEQYHLWTAIGVLASCASRHVWIDMGHFTVYPNQYIVLVGPAGNGKTTAMRAGARMVKEIGRIPCSADCQSSEDIVKMLAKEDAQQVFQHNTPTGITPIVYTHLSMFVTELSNFIGIDPVKMLDFLVTIYDTDESYTRRTLKHGEHTILRPCINLIGCTVPEWISTYLKADIINGGFSRRCVFVMEDWSDRRVPRPIVTDDQRQAWRDCVAWGIETKGLTGKFTWTEESTVWWDKWYLKRPISRDPNVSSFDKTRPILVLKLAMLLQLGVSHDLLLTQDNLEVALVMSDQIMKRLPDVYGSIGRNELAQVSHKVLSMLSRNGPMPEKEVLRVLWSDATAQEMIAVLQQLINQEKIVRLVPKEGQGRVMLMLTTEITDNNK